NTNNIICSIIANKSNFEHLIKFCRTNFNIGLIDIQAESIYDLEQTAQMISFIFLGLSVIFGFIAVLTTINVISLSINNKKKEIGILRALGTKNKDIEKIFIFQNFVVSLFSFVISMAFVYLGVFFINIILSLNSIANTIYLIADIYCWLIAFGVSFVLSFVACIIPLKIINKMNPIDSIRCIN
ncbi:MAG: ABC transporter permease, partial [Christensenellales bacterium]